MKKIHLVEGSFYGLADVEAELFEKHLSGFGGQGLEIGCCDGYSTSVILEASGLDCLTSYDPLIPDSMERSLCGSEVRLRANTRKYGTRHRHFLRKSSDMIHTGYLDFLFIDGDHSYPGALYDFDKYTPFILINGLLAMHDCRMGREGSPNFHEGPSRVAREKLFGNPDWEIVGEAFSLVIARKLR